MMQKRFIWLSVLLSAVGFSLCAEVKEGAGHEYDNIKIVQKADRKEAVLSAAVAVNLNKVVRHYDRELFGLSYDNSGNDLTNVYNIVPGKAYPVISPHWLKAAEGLAFPFNRIFLSDDNWKISIGPLAERKPHKKVPWDPGSIQVCGPVEQANALRMVDPEAKFNVCVSLTDKTVGQAREIAEFLMGPPDTPWGRKRVEYGMAKPLVPYQWEMGNERDWSTGKITIQEYIRLCKGVMAEIRKVQPDARFTVCSATAPWHETQKKGWREWNQTLLKELGKDIVSLSFHPYYHGFPLSIIEQYMGIIKKDIADSPNPKVKIFVSEYGKWPGGKPGRWENSWFLTHALVGCLDAAEWMTRMLDHPEVDVMTMHAFSSGPWGMFYADEYSKQAYGTALADLFRLYRKIPFGGEVVECKLSGAETSLTDGKMTFSGSAVKSGNRLYLLLVNRLPNTARETALSLPGNWKAVEHYCLTGPDIEAVNTAADRPVQILSLKPQMAGSKVMIPARSANVLVFEK